MYKCIISISALLAASSLSAQAEHALLERARGVSDTGPDYSFVMSFKNSELSGEAFVDPGQPIGRRVKVLSPALKDQSDTFKKMVKAFDAAPAEELWCSDFIKLIGNDAKIVRETAKGITFAFSPLPGPDDDATDRRFLSEMTAHLTLDRDTATVRRFSMQNGRPFKPIFIAKISTFKMEALCEPSPDGRTYLARFETRMSGKIALKKITEHEVRIITDLQVSRE